MLRSRFRRSSPRTPLAAIAAPGGTTGGSEVGHSSESPDLTVTLRWPDCVQLSSGRSFLITPSINLQEEMGVEGSWRGTIKPEHTLNAAYCWVLREGAWIYEPEPDWVVNLTRWACGRSPCPPSLCCPFSSPRMPWCMHWARVMLGSRGAEAGLLRLVNALTGVGIQRPPFSHQKTWVRGEIAALATAVFIAAAQGKE